MKRGDLVTVAFPGDFGKPRPALVIQSDQFLSHPTVGVLPLSSYIVDAPTVRISIGPTPQNGLRVGSQIMVDKIMTAHRSKVGPPFGRLDEEEMLAVTQALALFLGFG